MPTRNSSSRDSKRGPDFLKAEHIQERGKTPMNVLEVGYIGDSGYGLKMNFIVEVKKKKFTFGIKPTNLSIKTLINRAIQKKSVMVERDEYDGKEYVKISEDQ